MEVVEDMKLGKLIKNAGFRSGLGIAPELVWLRWYSGAGNIVRGLTKNMFAALNFSVPLSLFHLAQMFVACILPLAGLAFGSGWVRVFAGDFGGGDAGVSCGGLPAREGFDVVCAHRSAGHGDPFLHCGAVDDS